MKLIRFKEPQILSILRQVESGVPVAELCRDLPMVKIMNEGKTSLTHQVCATSI